MPPARSQPAPSLGEIARQWLRIGCVGFGGPPAHVALLRELCVDRRRWLSERQFEHALAATSLLPGPASTQLAIYCAWRLRGRRGAVIGGLGFIVPGLILLLGLSAAFLSSSPPSWLRGAGMGAGAAVAAVAVDAGMTVAAPLYRRASERPGGRQRLLAYALVSGVAAALTGPWLVLVLLGCGMLELGRGGAPRSGRQGGALSALLPASRDLGHGALLAIVRAMRASPALLASVAPGGVGALAWTSLKVGALAFGGGFVIVPLMQSDAVSTYHWMSHGQFLGAVALGQVTPGPVTHTVAAVGYSAGGLAGALFAALIAFLPSFTFVLLGASRFERLTGDLRARAFLAGAAPAAAGAIVGSAVPLATSLSEGWQIGVLAGACVALLLLRRGVVSTLLAAGVAGALAALLGAPAPH